MAQSNSNESNVRGIPSFWQNHTVDPPIPWEEWSDLFQLAIIAKENIDIENLLNPSERYHPLPPTLENPPENESDAQKPSRTERKIREQKKFDDEEMASIKSETKKFNGMRLEEADKNFRSILYLALGNEGKKIFGRKFTRAKALQISFKEFWENFSVAFVRKTNITFRKTQAIKQKTERQRIIRTILGGTCRNAKKM